MSSIRNVWHALLARVAPRLPAQPGRPAAAPTLGAFGLLVSQGDTRRQ